MNTETSEPPAPTNRATPVPEPQDIPTVERDALGKLFLRLVTVGAGIAVGAILAMILGFSWGWIGC